MHQHFLTTENVFQISIMGAIASKSIIHQNKHKNDETKSLVYVQTTPLFMKDHATLNANFKQTCLVPCIGEGNMKVEAAMDNFYPFHHSHTTSPLNYAKLDDHLESKSVSNKSQSSYRDCAQNVKMTIAPIRKKSIALSSHPLGNMIRRQSTTDGSFDEESQNNEYLQNNQIRKRNMTSKSSCATSKLKTHIEKKTSSKKNGYRIRSAKINQLNRWKLNEIGLSSDESDDECFFFNRNNSQHIGYINKSLPSRYIDKCKCDDGISKRNQFKGSKNGNESSNLSPKTASTSLLRFCENDNDSTQNQPCISQSYLEDSKKSLKHDDDSSESIEDASDAYDWLEYSTTDDEEQSVTHERKTIVQNNFPRNHNFYTDQSTNLTSLLKNSESNDLLSTPKTAKINLSSTKRSSSMFTPPQLPSLDLRQTRRSSHISDSENGSVKDTKTIKRKRANLPSTKPNVKSGNWLTNRYTINNYILLHSLGKGSYAEVRLCKDKKTNKLHAMKIMNKNSLHKRSIRKYSTFLDDAKREIAIMKKLRHENVLRLYEVMDDPNVNKLYLVLEYMKEGDLL